MAPVERQATLVYMLPFRDNLLILSTSLPNTLREVQGVLR